MIMAKEAAIPKAARLYLASPRRAMKAMRKAAQKPLSAR
jgi:hypothetical protein